MENVEQFDDRLKRIEDRLERIENRLGVYTHPHNLEKMIHKPLKEKEPSRLLLWIKENWFLGIGYFLVILAGGWFVGYSFADNWIGENARIILSALVGLAIYIVGCWLLKKQPRRGSILIALGEAVMILALFAGYQLYDTLPAFQTFVLMLGITATTTLIAIMINSEGLGFISIVLTMIIPTLVLEENSNYFILFNYVLLVDVMTLCMLIMRGWGCVFHVTWLATLLYSSQLGYLDNRNMIVLYIFLFYLLYFIPAGLSVCGKIDRLPLTSPFLLLASAITLIIWVESFTTFEGLFYCVGAALSFYFSYIMAENWNSILPSNPKLKYRSAICLSFTVMLFIFMAIHSWFSFERGIIAYLLGISLAMAVARFVLNAPSAAVGLSCYFVLPLFFIMRLNLYDPLYLASFHDLNFAILCAAVVSFAAALWVVHGITVQEEFSFLQKRLSASLWAIFGIFTMMLIWNLCYNLVPQDSVARSVAILIYVICALILICFGNRNEDKHLRWGGFAMMAFVTWRLLFIEIWEMPVVIRAITFVLVGLLLIGTRYFNKKVAD